MSVEDLVKVQDDIREGGQRDASSRCDRHDIGVAVGIGLAAHDDDLVLHIDDPVFGDCELGVEFARDGVVVSERAVGDFDDNDCVSGASSRPFFPVR